MTTLEQTILNLESLWGCLSPVNHNCGKCSYREKHLSECRRNVIKDALYLLKEQAPRVMTADEIFDRSQQLDASNVFLEYIDYDYGGNIFVEHAFLSQINHGPGHPYRIVANFPLGDRMRFKPEEYGIKWRAWTAEPTEDQREAAPWN